LSKQNVFSPTNGVESQRPKHGVRIPLGQREKDRKENRESKNASTREGRNRKEASRRGEGGRKIKKEEGNEVCGVRGLIECGCACSQWPVVDSLRIGGKLWVGPLSYMTVV